MRASFAPANAAGLGWMRRGGTIFITRCTLSLLENATAIIGTLEDSINWRRHIPRVLHIPANTRPFAAGVTAIRLAALPPNGSWSVRRIMTRSETGHRATGSAYWLISNR